MRIWPRGGRAFLEVGVWSSSCEDCMLGNVNERTVDPSMLLFARQGDSLRGIRQSASQSDADQWLTAWMLYLWLADAVGVYGAVHVDCGAVLLSQNGFPDSISNAADIRMLTMSMRECQVWSIAACTFSSNKLTVHFIVNVLPGSNWSCCHAPAQ